MSLCVEASSDYSTPQDIEKRMNKHVVKVLVCVGLLVAMLAVPAMAAEKRQGGTLTLMVRETDAHVQNFNPYDYAIGYYQAREWIYEPLYIFNVMHPDKDSPWLATKYEYSSDLKSITLTLREGVKWSDGEVFDADDVMFTVNLKKDHPEVDIGPFWDTQEGEGLLASIEKLGQYQVRFNLKKPSSIAHIQICGIYPLPEHIWKDVKDPLKFENAEPVGTGPFTKVLDFKPTVYFLGRNENYWQPGKPYIEKLRFPQYGNNEQVMASAAKGEVDWFGGGLTDAKLYTANNPNNKYWLTPGGAVKLNVNTTKAPFNNLQFRQAMSMAINRKDLLEVATFGLTIPVPYPGGIGKEYEAWWDHKRMEPYKYLMDYTPDAAKKLLDEAGFVDKDGDNWRDNPDGTPIKFKISVPTGWTDWVNSVMTIAENLQDIGINAEMQTPDEGAWFEAIPAGDFDVYIMWGIESATPHEVYNQMFNPLYMQKGKLHTIAMHQMQLPKVMELLDQFAATTDFEKQKDLLGQVQEEVAKNLPFIVLFSNPTWYEYSTARFEGWANEENPFLRPAVHGGYPERLVHLLNLSLKEGVNP